MKIKLMLTFCVWATAIGYAQQTYIPDENFEQALIDLGLDEGVPDHYISNANVSHLKTLNVSGRNIASLVGIAAFTSLENLFCYDNQLTYLYVDQNPALKSLYCYGNQIEELDLASNTALQKVFCGENQLTSLDVSQNPALTHLSCEQNQLSDLNLDQNLALVDLNCSDNVLTSLTISNNDDLVNLNCANNQLAELDLKDKVSLRKLNCNNNQITHINLNKHPVVNSLSCSNNQLKLLMLRNGNNKRFEHFEAMGNTLLTCIEVDDASWSITNWNAIDPQAGFNEKCNTYVPDDNFEAYLIERGLDSGELDDYVPTANIATETYVSVFNRGIYDLTGIEDFAALDNFNCRENNISKLDVSKNANLRYLHAYDNTELNTLIVGNNANLKNLYCYNAQISTIKIGDCPSLENLYCHNNQITELKLDGCTGLKRLYCHNNQIVDLDLSQQPDLYYLNCRNNQLQTLNVENGNNTNFTYFKSFENPELTCIQVDDPAYSEANWTYKDAWSSFSPDCHFDDTYIPDENFEQALIDNGWDDVIDHYVLTANIKDQTTVTIPGNPDRKISDLTGIQAFEAMVILYCPDNELTTLDLSQNTNLKGLISNNNQLTSIDFGDNDQMVHLYCWNNQLTELDMSNQPDLLSLLCYNNQLTSLNIKNGNNISMINFDTRGNPDLSCIQVDDPSWSTANWSLIDNWSGFADDCSPVYVPDDSFEKILIALGYDTVMDNYVLAENILNVEVLNLWRPTYPSLELDPIEDLTGIERFVSLKELNCTGNNVNNVDVSNNVNLEKLFCSNNYLIESLDVSKNVNLNYLYCSYNKLQNLDLTENVNLSILRCDNNNLVSIDISNNANLMSLVCSNNNLSFLDVTKNENLEYLYANNNNLMELDLSNNKKLIGLTCSNNNISNLDLTNNSSLIRLECENNTNLTHLNVKNGKTELLSYSFNAKNNSSLYCIQVDDPDWARNNLNEVDPWVGFAYDCSDVYVPDDVFEEILIELGIDDAMDNYVSALEVEKIIELIIPSYLFDWKEIKDMTGIERFLSLKTLDCATHKINFLNLSNNVSLEKLYCNSNNLSILDLSNNLHLDDVDCSYNTIKSLDLSNNVNLKKLYCRYNNLSTLNIKNGHNTSIQSLFADGNLNLNCIQVDNVSFAEANWRDDVDSQVIFSTNCGQNLKTGTTAQQPHFIVNPTVTEGTVTVWAEVAASYTLYYANGEKVQGGYFAVGENVLDLSAESSGVYVLRINAPTGNQTVKLVKE